MNLYCSSDGNENAEYHAPRELPGRWFVLVNAMTGIRGHNYDYVPARQQSPAMPALPADTSNNGSDGANREERS